MSGKRMSLQVRLLGGGLSRSALIVALICCWPTHSTAQVEPHVRFERLSLEAGLSQSSINTVLHDSRGFMWFGTQDGLNRYDGYVFTVFKSIPTDSTTLSGNFIQSLLEDSEGNIWVGTNQSGLNRYDWKTETFTRFVSNPLDSGTLSNNLIASMLEDRYGMIWIRSFGQQPGLDRLDKKTSVITRYRHDPDDPKTLNSHTFISDIHEDHEGGIWVGTVDGNNPAGGGLHKYMRDEDVFIRFVNVPKDPNSLSGNAVSVIHEDSLRNLWIGTFGSGVNRLNRSDGTFTRYSNVPGDVSSLSDNNVSAIFEDRDGEIWIGTQGGMNRFSRASGSFVRFQNKPGDPKSLANNQIRFNGLTPNESTILQDAEGDFWIVTAGNGVERFNRETGRCEHFENDQTNPHSLSGNLITTLYADDYGTLWIGTVASGINKLSLKKEKFLRYVADPFAESTINDRLVWSVFKDRAGVLWIGTGNGLNRFDRSTGRIKHFVQNQYDPTSLSNNFVRAIHEDENGVMWIGTGGGGLNRFNRSTETFLRYQNDPNDDQSISSNQIFRIYQDRKGYLWITTVNGVNRFDRRTGKFKRFVNDPADTNSLSVNQVRPIIEDRDGIFWMGLAGGGINTYDPKTGEFSRYQYDVRDTSTISHNNVMDLVEDEAGTIWVGTFGGGLCRVMKDAGGRIWFRRYSERQGLPNNVIYGILVAADGHLWLSTNFGLSRFDPVTETFKNFDLHDGLQSNEFNGGAFFKSPVDGEMFFGGINGFNSFYPEQVSDNLHQPPVVISAFKKFDRPVRFDLVISTLEEIVLSHKDNFFGFEFVGLDYTNPAKNRYAYRLVEFDDDWIYCGTRRYASYTNLDPGEYLFRVKGSNSDGVWNETGASIRVVITPPFWATLWFRFLAVVLVLGTAFAGYRMRIRNIERQKIRLEKQVAERTVQLQQKKDELEKINVIVKSINSEIDFIDLLNSVLKESRVIKGVEKATALVRDKDDDVFRFKASSGWPMEQLSGIRMSRVDAEARYITRSEEIYDDVFIARNVKGREGEEKFSSMGIPKSMLIMRVRIGEEIAGFLIFDNMNQEDAFEERDIELLKNLREHILSAFIKARILEEKTNLLNEVQIKNEKIVLQSREIEGQRDDLKEVNDQLGSALKGLKDAQSQLVHSEKMASLGKMVAGIAHEINNPLSFIYNNLDHVEAYIRRRDRIIAEYEKTIRKKDAAAFKKIKEKYEYGFITRDSMDIISAFKTGSERIKRIVEDLRTFSRLDESDLKKVDLHKGLDSSLVLLRNQYKNRIEIIREYLPVDEVECFPGQINQVFMNVLANAIQAIPDRGKIFIRTEQVDGQVRVRIRDTGVGIPADVRKKIFDPFFTTKDVGEGTGLGLSISYGIVRNHDGALLVESEPGKGSEFVIELPVRFNLENLKADMPSH